MVVWWDGNEVNFTQPNSYLPKDAVLVNMNIDPNSLHLQFELQIQLRVGVILKDACIGWVNTMEDDKHPTWLGDLFYVFIKHLIRCLVDYQFFYSSDAWRPQFV